MDKFLIIQTAFIGDVVLATALAEKLHQDFPEAQIDFLLRKGNESLLAAHPFIGEVLVWDKRKNKFLHLLRLISRIRKRRYDKVINVQRFAATGLLTFLSGAKETIGFNKNPFSFTFSRSVKHRVAGKNEQPVHEIDRNQALIASFSSPGAARPALYPDETQLKNVAPLKSIPYITLSPASVWFTKQYPAERWAAFLGQVPDSIGIYLLGAGSDREAAETIIQSSARRSAINLCGQLGFLESAALMKDALMNYVNDSAPLHFASAVNAPVAAIYCSTLPSFGFGPLSDQQFIVETREALSCRPCGLHGKKACPLGHFKCGYGIETAQLLELLPSTG